MGSILPVQPILVVLGQGVNTFILRENLQVGVLRIKVLPLLLPLDYCKTTDFNISGGCNLIFLLFHDGGIHLREGQKRILHRNPQSWTIC